MNKKVVYHLVVSEDNADRIDAFLAELNPDMLPIFIEPKQPLEDYEADVKLLASIRAPIPVMPAPIPVMAAPPTPATSTLIRELYNRDTELDAMDCLNQTVEIVRGRLNDDTFDRVVAWFNSRYGS